MRDDSSSFPLEHGLHGRHHVEGGLLVQGGGLCFDLLALALRKKLPISSIRVKKFCQDSYFTSSRVAATGFVPPAKLEDGLKQTIEYEFINKIQGHTFSCE